MSQILSSAGYHGEGRLARKANTNQLSKITTEMPPLIMFACGWKHNVFITTDHHVYVCGDNSDGQIGPEQQSCLIPTLSPRLSTVNPIWASCGDKMTVLLTEDCRAFACGVGWGLGPVELTAPSDIVFVSCGVSIICGIGSNGEFYVWSNHISTARHIPSDAQFCDCAAGNFQIFALSTTGVLYVTGRSKSCGQGRKWASNDLVPVMALSKVVIRRIFAYCNHSVAVDEEGRVYVCGSNNYGQLGLGSIRKANVFLQVPIFDEHPVLFASLGDTFTAFLTESLELYTCGDGDEYRLCNTSIGKVRTPQPADAALGRSVMWMSCGCSHMIIAENLEEVPQHPARLHFGLDGTTRRKRKKLPMFFQQETIVSNAKSISVDISDYGTIWTGYMNGDKVFTKEFGSGNIIGVASRGIAVRFSDGVHLFDLKDLQKLHEQLKIEERPCTVFKEVISRGGSHVFLDVTGSSCRVFGFAPGDRVKHPVLGSAVVQGVFGGCLWFTFDDDENTIVTTLSTDPSYLHKWLEIYQPKDRTVSYQMVEEYKWPIETSPCEFLDQFDLQVDDLVQTPNGIGKIFGTFRHYVVLSNFQNHELHFITPSSLLLLRRFSSHPAYVDRLSLNGSSVHVDVSCNEDDSIMPFDRVITPHGHATYVGKTEDLFWIATDDAAALGAGIGSVADSSDFKVVRRIGFPAIQDELSVSSDDFLNLPILPDDVICVDNDKYRVLGRKEDIIHALHLQDSTEKTFRLNEVKDISIVYRVDLPASRIYLSKTGNGLSLSVSLHDFVGMRMIPDDIVKTPFGNGVVIGVVDSNIGIHIIGDDGVSFFTQQAIYDPIIFQILQRRVVVSLIPNQLRK